MKESTKTVLDAIKADTAETIVPMLYSHFYSRAATSAAFRIAKRDGIIEVAYISCAGTPVYRKPAKPENATLH